MIGRDDDFEAQHEASVLALRNALAASPIVRRRVSKRAIEAWRKRIFWVSEWTLGADPGTDGLKFRTCIVARSRAERREGIVCKFYERDLYGKTDEQHSEIIGPALAEALVKLGLGWIVLRKKLAAAKAKGKENDGITTD
jgi:hypothetical protein